MLLHVHAGVGASRSPQRSPHAARRGHVCRPCRRDSWHYTSGQGANTLDATVARLKIAAADAPAPPYFHAGWSRRAAGHTTGKEDRTRPLFFPVANADGEALHWGQRPQPGEAFWTNGDSLHIWRAPRARQMFRSLLGPWLGTTPGKNNGEPLVYGENRRRWRYAWARNAACSRFTSSRHRSQ